MILDNTLKIGNPSDGAYIIRKRNVISSPVNLNLIGSGVIVDKLISYAIYLEKKLNMNVQVISVPNLLEGRNALPNLISKKSKIIVVDFNFKDDKNYVNEDLLEKHNIVELFITNKNTLNMMKQFNDFDELLRIRKR